jgi:hypothetical protein
MFRQTTKKKFFQVAEKTENKGKKKNVRQQEHNRDRNAEETGRREKDHENIIGKSAYHKMKNAKTFRAIFRSTLGFDRKENPKETIDPVTVEI